MAITKELIIFLVIVGCLASVFIGYGIYALSHNIEEEGYRKPGYEQSKYMREVRSRNLGVLQYEAKRRDVEAQ
ncbi:hypothetical protein AWENTII_002353 [Aspergillus wentii]